MLEVVESVEGIRSRVRTAKRANQVVGLVPTMGALHAGHARLIEQAHAECGLVAVSIFVNPTQFGPNEDFERYPRTLDADLQTCEAAGASVVFVPTVAAMYPAGRNNTTFVEVPAFSTLFEGAVRPGHFRGVATVVTKLFTIGEPDLAFFGAKDYQQQLVIRRMVTDLNLPVEIRAVATVREPDGLAMSSRNRYLDPAQRRAATVLARSLALAEEIVKTGERDANRVRQVLTETIESEGLARIDYAEVVDGNTLDRLARLDDAGRVVALLAVRFGSTRLIDNAVLLG